MLPNEECLATVYQASSTPQPKSMQYPSEEGPTKGKEEEVILTDCQAKADAVHDDLRDLFMLAYS